MADARKSNPQHAGLRVTCFCTLWRYCQVSNWLPTVIAYAIGSSTNARLRDRMNSFFVRAGSYAIAAVSMDHFALNTSSIVETQRLVSAVGLDVSEANRQARKTSVAVDVQRTRDTGHNVDFLHTGAAFHLVELAFA